MSAYRLARFCLPLALLFLLGAGAGAQVAPTTTDFLEIRPKQNSPLSRFGLGDPLDRVHAAQAGMGALQSTYQNPFHLNLVNPASLASLQATSFEVGLYGRYGELIDRDDEAATVYQGNLSYIALGFPLRNPINLSLDQQLNRWNAGMAFSLAPTTLVGYDLQLAGFDEGIGPTSNQLKGTGGVYRFSWSTALRLRGLSAGLNVNYNFGKLTNSRIVTFDSIPEALATEFLEDISIRGFSFGYGLQYSFNFKDTDEEGERVPNGKRIIVAASGDIGATVETDASLLFRRFSPGGFGIRDTLDFDEGSAGKLDLPASYSFGLAFEDFNRLFIGAEWGRTAHGSYRNTARPEQLADADRIALGFQYIPNGNSYNSYWKRIRYRLGLRLEEDPRTADGAQARRNAVTLGAGFPIQLPRQQVSFMDVAVELGKFGVPDVIDETYVQLTVGFSLNDNSWFFKRKLN